AGSTSRCEAGTTMRASAALDAEEDGAGEVVAVEQLLRGALELHLALLEEDRAVGDRERDVERLLDDEHRLAARAEPVDELEHALDHYGREAERELVDQEDLGLLHQHACQGEHLLPT